MLTVHEAALFIDRSPVTVRWLCRNKRIADPQLVAGKWQIPEASLNTITRHKPGRKRRNER